MTFKCLVALVIAAISVITGAILLDCTRLIVLGGSLCIIGGIYMFALLVVLVLSLIWED